AARIAAVVRLAEPGAALVPETGLGTAIVTTAGATRTTRTTTAATRSTRRRRHRRGGNGRGGRGRGLTCEPSRRHQQERSIHEGPSRGVDLGHRARSPAGRASDPAAPRPTACAVPLSEAIAESQQLARPAPGG